MHILYDQDGTKCLFHHENAEVELIHNGTVIIGGSIFNVDVLNILRQNDMLERLAMHAADIKGWLDILGYSVLSKSDQGLVPDQSIIINCGHDYKVRTRVRMKDNIIIFTQEEFNVDTNRWEEVELYREDFGTLRKVVTFFETFNTASQEV